MDGAGAPKFAPASIAYVDFFQPDAAGKGPIRSPSAYGALDPTGEAHGKIGPLGKSCSV